MPGLSTDSLDIAKDIKTFIFWTLVQYPFRFPISRLVKLRAFRIEGVSTSVFGGNSVALPDNILIGFVYDNIGIGRGDFLFFSWVNSLKKFTDYEISKDFTVEKIRYEIKVHQKIFRRSPEEGKNFF